MKSDTGYRQFLLRLPAPLMNKIEMAAGKRNATKFIYKILLDYMDENHPDVLELENKILFHEKEIARIRGAMLNVGNIRTVQQQELQDMDQFREDKKDSVITMLFVHYISGMGSDDIDYKKWMNTLKFNEKADLLDYLDQKWEEYGRDGVLRRKHKLEFIRSQMKEIKKIAKGRLLEVEEYMTEKNINLDVEYEAGKIRGSIKDFKN